jgi:hypothetical protein
VHTPARTALQWLPSVHAACCAARSLSEVALGARHVCNGAPG